MRDDGYTTPDEAEAYARGYARAQRNHARANRIDAQIGTDNGTDLAIRIAAFGAIRRAAKIAREFDERGIWDPELWITADAIRRAIRAAIGSDKA